MTIPTSVAVGSKEEDLIREYPSAIFDWKDSTVSPPGLNINIFVNNTHVDYQAGKSIRGVPYRPERWNKAINMASRALFEEVRP